MKLGQRVHAPLREAPEGGYTVPFFFQPTYQEFQECTVYDNNEDFKTWSYSEDSGGSFMYTWNSSKPGDDWCILPDVFMTPGNYKVSFSYRTRNYEEKFRVAIGHGNDFENYQTIAEIEDETQTLKNVSEIIAIDSEGEYNIGLYCYSDQDKYYLNVCGIGIEAISDEKPNMPEVEITSVGTQAQMSITFPTENFGGNSIVGVMTAIVCEKNKEEPVATVTGMPGETKIADFAVLTSGAHTFYVTASVEVNGQTYESDKVTVEHFFTKIRPEILPLGYLIEPDEDEFVWSEVINSNEDALTWTFENQYLPSGNEYNGAFYYYYSSSNKADDWIIVPAYSTEGHAALRLSFDVATKTDTESLEIGVSSTPTIESLQENIIWNDQELYTNSKFENRVVDFTYNEGDEIYIAFHATSPVNKSSIYIQGICLTAIDPAIPNVLTLSDPTFDGGNGTVKLTMPTLNMGGEQIEGTIYADVILDDEIYYNDSSVEGTAGEEILLTFNDLSLGTHKLTAFPYVIGEDGMSIYGNETELSFKIVPSSDFAYTIPLDLTFNDVTGDLMQVFNENSDSSTWYYDSTTQTMKYSYHSTNPGDDWFITPAIEFTDAEVLYDIIVTAWEYSSHYVENFEIFLGTEPTVEAMTIKAMPQVDVVSTNQTDFSNFFAIPAAGRYYLGVHATSPANAYHLFLSEIKIQESSISPDGPGEVTDLTGVGNITGALDATISFKFPTVNLTGSQLPEGQELTATVASSEETKEVTGTPGSEASVVIACPQGNSEVEVYVTNSIGQGLTSKVSVHCGLDKPKDPEITGLVISEDNGSVTISWNAVTEGVTGGNVNPAGMDYYIL